MSNYYGQHPQQGASNTAGGDNFYNQGGYGQDQQGNGSGGYSGGYAVNQQSQQQTQQWHQPAAAPAPAGPMGNGVSQTQPQPSENQPSQTQQQASFWNPAAAATVMSAATGGKGLTNDAMLDLASGVGKSFLESGSARMVPGLESFMMMLRVYFAVDNRYVKRKMQKVLFPFTSRQWRRLVESEPTGPEGQIEYSLPLSDENAPDLYLPIMSLVTYVLLCALCYGTAGQFNPEVIPDVSSKCIVTQILEVLAIRFGFYAMQASIPFLDLFGYTGYKYLGLCVNMLVGLAAGHLGYGHIGYYITFLWTASAATYFMLKTMANNIPKVTADSGPKREVMVVAFAASQFASMWLVSQTKFLN